MAGIPVIAVVDIGKTNKKLLVFDQAYTLVLKRDFQIREITDREGYPCEDLSALQVRIFELLDELIAMPEYELSALNFSAYGASLVLLDYKKKVIYPMVNYLKSYPFRLRHQFYLNYGGEEAFSLISASPAMGSLNAGMQLYRIRYEDPVLFEQVRFALHFPQYLSFLVTGQVVSELTSIGCHTNLWNFQTNSYQEWVKEEKVSEKLAPIIPAITTCRVVYKGRQLQVGCGLHDSSAALSPYLKKTSAPFILISTGTWCISMNPFNAVPLTARELKCDCLTYLSHEGRPVKASRIFAGNEHEQQLERIAAWFQQPRERYLSLPYDAETMHLLKRRHNQGSTGFNPTDSGFGWRSMKSFQTDTEAYHQLMADIVREQVYSVNLIRGECGCRKLFVDGGFSKNFIYMQLLADELADLEVYSALMPELSALGAALVIHESWNNMPVPDTVIGVKRIKALH